MSQSEFQQAKEKALEDLRKIREELLQRERSNDKKQTKTEPKSNSTLKLKVLEKKEKHKDKKHKKHKKSEKEKKHKRKERRKSSSSDEEEVPHKKHKHKDKKQSSSSEEESVNKEHQRKERKYSSSSEEENVPKKRSCSPEITRDDWMTSSVLLKTFSKNKPVTKTQTMETYEPGKSSRELNPYWKDGGSGLPSFKKPKDDSDNDDDSYKKYSKSYKSSSKSWQKKTDTVGESVKKDQDTSLADTTEKVTTPPEFLSDQQMNELGAKIMKAELLNNKELAEELKSKLSTARLFREQNVGIGKEINKSRNKPNRKSHYEAPRARGRNTDGDEYGELQSKFERETKNKTDRSKAAEESKRFNEDFDDIFGTAKRSELENDKLKEIKDKHRPTKRVNNCDKCFNSEKMNKELVVSVGKHVYVALPWHEGLQTNHCLILPIDHYSCSTDLDEDVWQEVSKYRRLLTKIFSKRKQDVLFFETARFLQKRRHMVIHCIPSSKFEMAPFYFKKAIEESEYEWSKNKQLVTLKDKNLRKSIPNGLPYFWVNFGMDFGFAHVIENQENFPLHFAQEIIGGMLTLDMRKWRTPRQEHNVKTKVKNLADLLKPYELEES